MVPGPAGPANQCRIQVLVTEAGDESGLESWLNQSFDIITADLPQEADCYLVDERMAARHREFLQDQIDDAHPEFLPVIVIRGVSSPGELDISSWKTNAGIPVVAEVIDAPVDKSTLENRLETLQFRRYQSTLQSEVDRLENQFQRLFEASNDAIFVLSGDGSRIADCNPATVDLTGYGMSELEHMDPMELFGTNRPEEFSAFLDETKSTGSARSTSVSCQTKHRSHRLVDVSSTVVEFEQGKSIFLIARDVTDQTRQMNQVQVLNRVMRHDIRNKLTIIRGLFAELGTQLDVIDLINEGINETDQLLEMSEKVRSFTRLADQEYDDSRIHAEALIEKAISKVLLEHPDAEFEPSHIEDSTIPDFPGLDWALIELLENAVIHGTTEHPIVIEVEQSEGGVQIAVRDRGPGIPEEELKVFQQNDIAPLEHASGLGLWMTTWLLERYQVNLDVESTESGTTAMITVPTTTTDHGSGNAIRFGSDLSHRGWFETIFDESPDPILLTTDEGRITDLNTEAERLLGQSTDELLGKKVVNIVSEQDAFEASWERLQSTETKRGEFSLAQNPDRVIEYTATALPTGGILLMFREVTERYQRETALNRTLDLLQHTEKIANVGSWEINPDTMDVYWSDQIFDLLEIDEEEEPPIEDILEMYHPADRSIIEENIEHALETGESFNVEARIRTSSGNLCWLNILGVPTKEEGDVVALRGAVQDITEQKRRQDELKRIKERYETILAHSFDYILIVDGDGDVDYVSPAVERVLGYTPSELLGEDAFEFVHPEDREIAAEAFADVITNPEAEINAEYRTKAADGSYRWIEVRGGNFLDHPDIEGVLVSVRDITERKEQKRELRQLKDEYETVFKTAQDGIFLFNVDKTDGEYKFTLQNLNPAHEAASDMSIKDDRGKTPEQFLGDEEGQKVVENYRRCVEAQEPISYEEELEMPGGTIYWHTRLAPVIEDGEVTQLVSVARDITERKERERNLTEIKQRLELALQESAAGIWEWDIETGELYWSEELLQVLGYSNDEFSGTIEFLNEKLHPDDVERTERAIDTALETGEHYHIEQRVQTTTGEYRWLDVRGQVIDDSNTTRMVGIGFDITEKVERERDLRLFRKAAEASGHSIYFTDKNGIIEYVNPAFEEVTGYSAEEAIGMTPRILKSGVHDQEFYEKLWNTILGGDTWRNELINETKSGARYVVDQTIAPVKGDTSEIEHFVAVNADITEQKKNRERLANENELLDDFASVVSHDLRNPLNVAKGRLELANGELADPHIREASQALDRMETLIEDLLTLSKQGQAIEPYDNVSLQEVVTDCWENVPTANTELRVEANIVLRADPRRLQQLVENLFRNAVEHGGEDVTIRVGEVNDGFYIEDDGHGIPLDEREDVFEPGVSSVHDGTGIGLSIVQGVAEAHGWEIELTESDSGGARFEITGIEVVE